MNVAPAATYEAVVDWGETGKTIGMRVVDNAGNTTVARVTGFTEYPSGSGIYSRGGNTAPSVAGQYTLVYDDDGGTAAAGHVASEELVVTGNAAVAVSSGNEYTTLAELKATLNLSATTAADADLSAAIQAASRAIDNYCGQSFYLGSSSTVVRYYDALDSRYVAIDACASIATVALDQTGSRSYTAAAATDWEAVPYNASTDSQPYTGIEIAPMGSVSFPPTRRGVKVTGRWGWPAVPGTVTEACTILSSRYFKRAREAPFGVAGVGIDGAAIRIARTDPDVAMLLDPYVKRRLMV